MKYKITGHEAGYEVFEYMNSNKDRKTADTTAEEI